MSAPWPAPRATAPVTATVSVPGSKSVTNRALVLAALASGTSRLRRPLRSRDTELMVGALRALGVQVRDVGADWDVEGCHGPLPGGGGTVDVGNAGTVARFVPPVAALTAGAVRFDGDPRVRERPLGPLLTALRELGAELDDGGRGALPITVHGRGRVPGGTVQVDASDSSQLVSGLLLSAPRFEAGVTVVSAGSSVPSRPHLDMTVDMLRGFGAQVHADHAQWTVAAGPLSACDLEVEPDLSNAAPFLAAAAATGGEVTLAGWPQATTQPGALLPSLLEQMGASTSLAEDGLTVRGGQLHGLDADLRDCPEATPVLAALAALADSPSTLRGVAHLRLQETDRLAALAREISALGGAVRETEDGLHIEPRPLHGGVFATYADHRLAMAAAVLGLAVDGVRIEDIATTGKTMRDFPERWHRMLATSGVGAS